MFFSSLKKEIVIFILGLTVLTISITTVLSVSSINTAGDNAAKASSAVLRAQAEEFLAQIVDGMAKRQDLIFLHTKNDAANLAFVAQKIYENPSIFHYNSYWVYDQRVRGTVDGRYVNAKSDVSSVYIPQYVEVNNHVKTNLELTASLDFVVPKILENNENAVAIYTIDKTGQARYYPNIVLGEVVDKEHSTLDDIVFTQGTPENNPERIVKWSPLYDDPAKRGLMVTATAPIYAHDEFVGIVGVDVLLNDIIGNITSYSPIEGSYSFLVDQEGWTIAFPDRAYEDILGRPKKEGESRTDLKNSSAYPEFKTILQDMIEGHQGFKILPHYTGGEDLFVSYTSLPQTGYSMAVAVEEDVVLKSVEALQGQVSAFIGDTVSQRILPASILLVIIVSLVGFFLVTRIVNPILYLTKGAEEIGRGNLGRKINVRSKNEIGNLARSFNKMTSDLAISRQQLEEYSRGLEDKVQERTAELSRANTRLRELDNLKSEFLSFAAHQLRSPLTAIRGYASMILEGSYGKPTKRIKQSTEKIFLASTSLVKVVEDFLNITRIEQGRMKFTFKPMDLKACIEEIVNEQMPVAEKAGLALNLHTESGASYFMSGDGEKLKQVVSNLIDNAIKYTQKGGITMSLEKDEKEHKMRLSVADTGLGISPEILPELFTKFKRSEGASRVNIRGTGLGLYIAKEIVKAHHGQIWAKSDGEGNGSTFVVELPYNVIVGS
jgi:signal transduction histidine kinase